MARLAYALDRDPILQSGEPTKLLKAKQRSRREVRACAPTRQQNKTLPSEHDVSCESRPRET